MKRGKRGNESIYVPTRTGLVQRSCGTGHAAVVRGMKRMVARLKDEHRWTVLDALRDGRTTLSEAYQYHSSNKLADLEARLTSVDLADHLNGWIAWVRANRHAGVRTADVYWQQVTTLITKPFPAAELTKARVVQWLTSREKASSGTKRKYLYALKSFVRYGLDTGLLTVDPLAGLKAPRKNRPRERWVTADVDERIVQAASEQYRALFAFIKGTGCDLSSALDRALRGDVYPNAVAADIRGTKTDRRHVHAALVEPWAAPYILAHVEGITDPAARLWTGLTRSGAHHHHQVACRRAGVSDYTLKDSRHSVGVRMRKAGRTFEDIALQLGTSVYQAVTVYTRYQPDEAGKIAGVG